MQQRENWKGNHTFIVAAIGSAIGLAGLWRFPLKVYENGGGGAFLIAYLVAMLTAGIPLLIMEFSLGHRYKSSAPLSFAKISRKFEWLGWWAVLVGFVVVTYSAVIMAWSANYSVFAFTQEWGDNTGHFFYEEFLRVSFSPFRFGSIRLPILVTLLLSWLFMLGAIWKGVKTISRVIYFTVIIPWILLIILLIRIVTLPGSLTGVLLFLQPDFEQLIEPSVWLAAYGQVFFSLAIGVGVMFAYASFLPKHAGIINNAIVAGLATGATTVIGGITIFAALGYHASVTGVAISEFIQGGTDLLFITFTAVINYLPMPRLYGVLFFIMLFFLAFDTAFSMMMSVVTSLRDKFSWTLKKANVVVAIAGFGFGIIFVTCSGICWIQIVEKWVEIFGLSVVILLQTIVIGWFYRLERLRNYANQFSAVKIESWWNFTIRFLIPVVISGLLINSVINLVMYGFGDFCPKSLFIGGWLVSMLLPIIAVVITQTKRDSQLPAYEVITPKVPFKYDIAFKRLHRYFYGLFFTLIGIVILNVLNDSFFDLEGFLTWSIGIYVLLAFLGGALYFVGISFKEQEKREKWKRRVFDEK